MRHDSRHEPHLFAFRALAVVVPGGLLLEQVELPQELDRLVVGR